MTPSEAAREKHRSKMAQIRETIAAIWMNSPKEEAILDQCMAEIDRILSR